MGGTQCAHPENQNCWKNVGIEQSDFCVKAINLLRWLVCWGLIVGVFDDGKRHIAPRGEMAYRLDPIRVAPIASTLENVGGSKCFCSKERGQPGSRLICGRALVSPP
jgi:hypothetical protein